MADVQPIFNAKCGATCHLGNGVSGGLDLDSQTYDNLVYAPATQTNMDRVTPGDLANSYLWHKLQGTHSSVGGSGAKMPKGSSLTSSQLSKIQTWLEEGAPP